MNKQIDHVITTLMASEEKFAALCNQINAYGKLAVAYSGGVDSTFLLKVAEALLGDQAVAITARSSYIAKREIDEAQELAKNNHFNMQIIDFSLSKEIENNPQDRCYLCKKAIFSEIKSHAEQLGIHVVADGSNADDIKDYRPGMRALRELDIKSPLMDAGITKSEIRTWSRMLLLDTWDKPAYACLLTRLPYDAPIMETDLRMIERAESYIMDRGFKAIRVRKHGDVARIEVEMAHMRAFLDIALMKAISQHLKSLGFSYVTLDLEGYQMGSFNKGVVENDA